MAGSKELSKRQRKLSDRARSEMDVVENCRNVYEDKLKEIKELIDIDNARLVVLLERGKLSVEMSARIEIAGEIKKIRDNLSTMQDDMECLQDNVDMLDELIISLNSLFLHDQYRYIIRKIPEKKLPTMVRDVKYREEVNELLQSILQDCQAARQKVLFAKKKRKENRQKMKEVREAFRERNTSNPENELSSILAEFETDDSQTQTTVKTVRKNQNKS